MTGARDEILGTLRRSLGRGALDRTAAEPLEAGLAKPHRNLVPDRSARPHAELVDMFIARIEAVEATVDRVASLDDVPAALADYLGRHNLPSRCKLAPHPTLEELPWERVPMVECISGPAAADDTASLTTAIAAVAETGSIVTASGPHAPATLNFLPENHVVLVRADQVAGPLEEAWTRIRAAGAMPRTVNFITGPSRSADIEGTLVKGAHGPKRLHVILVEDGPQAGD